MKIALAGDSAGNPLVDALVAHLKGKGELKQPEAWLFETGKNEWREFDAWPPRQARPKSLYFHAGGRLAAEPPGEASGKAAACAKSSVAGMRAAMRSSTRWYSALAPGRSNEPA